MTPKKKGHHVSKTIWQLRRKRSMIVKEPPVAFLPRIRLSTPELFAKVFTNERMGIEISRIVRIFSREESLALLSLERIVRHSVGLKSVNDSVSPE